MQVEIWSDVVCPWCFVGKRRFESALAGFAHRGEVAVRWRSFELDPSAPRERQEPLAEHLAAKYGVDLAQAQQMQQHMSQQAAGEGLTFRFDLARPGNTFDAHRLLHLTADRGVQDAVKERLMAGYLCEGEPAGDPETLARLAGEAGLDRDEARAVLAGDAYAEAVRDDERTARRLGVDGVPFFVFDRAFAVSGAQPPEMFTRALEKARAAAQPLQTVGDSDAGACGPEGCEA
jgi:predicted DsbA family dithiol-disulfide isomerase